MPSLPDGARFLCGLVLLSGILTTRELRLEDPAVFAPVAAAEDEMVRTLSAETAIDASAATLGGLRSAMQREGELSSSSEGVGVVWWGGALSAGFQAHPLVRYLPSFLGKRFLASDEVASRINVRLSPRCVPEGPDGSRCTILWERSRFPGTLFGLAPGIDHEEALRRLALEPGTVGCVENASWIEGDPAVPMRRACKASTGNGWSVMWHENGLFQVASISAWRTP